MVERAPPTKSQEATMKEERKIKLQEPSSQQQKSANNHNKQNGKKRSYSTCKHCHKMGHPLFKTKCSKCNHLVHETVICQNKIQHDEGAQTVDQEEEQLFVAICFSTSESSECCTTKKIYFQDIESKSIF